jgi:transposase
MSDVQEADKLRGGRGRRQLWSVDRKRQIIAESFEPGASVAKVARRHGVNANLLFTWRRQQGAKLADSREVPQLVPVTIAAEPVSGVPAVASGPVGRMEIVLGAGERIIVGADVDTAALARVIKALSRPGRTGLV